MADERIAAAICNRVADFLVVFSFFVFSSDVYGRGQERSLVCPFSILYDLFDRDRYASSHEALELELELE